MTIQRYILAAVFVVGTGVVTRAVRRWRDWPQWQGPDRTGLSKETGLLQEWPRVGSAGSCGRGGTRQRLRLGGGQGRSHLRPGDDETAASIVSALNRADGKALWSKSLGRAGTNDQGPGPRGTPTIDGDRLYVADRERRSGVPQGRRHRGLAAQHPADFGGRNLRWLISESPLVDGNNVIVSPGGRNAGMVALDKMTGKTVWTSKDLSDRRATRRRSWPTSRACAPS